MAWRSFVICIGMLLLAITRCHCVALSKVPSPNPSVIWKFNSRGNSPQTKPKEVHSPRGRLMIGRHPRENAIVEEALVDADYQSDMGRDEAEAYFRAQGNRNANPSSVEVQKLMQTEPNVECTGDSIKLNVKGSFSTPGALFVVDRGSSLAPLPLSELPSSCGYTLKTTQRDLVLVAPYDGCFVSLEEEGYVLSLHWWGIPVRMSCPVRRRSLYNPPRVTCNTAGMVVNTDWASPVQKIQVNLNGLWKPLMEVLPRCGFGFEFASNAGGAAISIRYAPCLGVKDGMFTLGLAGDGAVKVSCPSVHIFDDPSKDVLPTVAPLKYPNNTLTGTLVGQEQNSLHLPPKAQITVIVPPKNPASPDNKLFWPPHPSGSQTPDQFPPHQTPFYPSLPVGPSQKPASPTSNAEGQEPVTPHKPPKTHDSKAPVGPEGQNAWPYPFPYNFWPPQPSQGPDLPTPGVPQKPAATASKTEGQEPVTHPKPHKTQINKQPVAPDRQNPEPWPSHPSASQTPDPFPPHQTPFYPPSLPVGPSQKPASPTSKAEGQEPVTPHKPPKTHDSKTPLGPEGQNAWPYPFPYYFWPPQPSQGPDLPTPGVPQKPASTTSRTEGQEPVTHPKPTKTQINKQPGAPDRQNPEPYQVPYFTWPSHPSASQTPDPFPPHQTPFYPPSLPVGPSQKPASPTSKAEGQEPVTPHNSPKTHDSKTPVGPEGQNAWPYPFPYHFWPPQPSQGPDLPTPGVPQKPASTTSKTEGPEPVTHPKPPKTQINKQPGAPDRQNPEPYQVPYFTWPSHPSASQTPDPFPPHQTPFYPPSLPVGPSQKPASPTSKAEGQEPVTPHKPPKTHDSKTPVGPEGQNAWPYPFPYHFWPPQPSQGPDLPTPGVPQKPASTTSKTEGQEPVTHPKPPKTQINKQPGAPDRQNPEPYQVPYFTWPSHPSASQTPDPFPPHQTPFYPPSLPVGPSQKPASPTSKAEGQEPVTPHKPPKTHDSKTPVGPEGQNAWPYPFPYHFWPPQPSQGPDLPTPGVPQKPASTTSKTEGQEPVTHPKPPKTQINKQPGAPDRQNPEPYQVPYFTWPSHPSASQTPDPFPPHQTPFYPPSLPVGPSQKPSSPTSKAEGQEPVTPHKPPKTHDSKTPVGPEGQNAWPYPFPYHFWPPQPSHGPDLPTPGVPQKPLTPTSKTEGQEPVTHPKPHKTHDRKTPVVPEGESEKGTPFNSLVHCPEKCLSGLSQCCVSFSYHHHDHFLYPLKDDRRIAPFSTLGQSVPEVMQGTLDSGLPNTIETSHDTIVNPPFENQEDKLHNFLSQAVKYASKGNQEFEYSPPEGILDQDLPIHFESSQSELGHPTFIQQYEQPKIELQSPDERQSPSQTLVTQGLFTILEPAMGHYDMVQDAMASSVDSTDYFEALHPLTNSRKFVKLTSERPLSNGHLLLEHGPPGSEPSFPRLAARGLGRSHTHLAFEPLRHYPQSKETSHPPQPGNQMDAMYRSKDQSNNILGQTFNRHSSVDGYPNGDVNQPFPRRMH